MNNFNIIKVYFINFLLYLFVFNFFNNFHNFLKLFWALKLEFFAYHPIPIRDTDTDVPQDLPSQWPIPQLWTMADPDPDQMGVARAPPAFPEPNDQIQNSSSWSSSKGSLCHSVGWCVRYTYLADGIISKWRFINCKPYDIRTFSFLGRTPSFGSKGYGGKTMCLMLTYIILFMYHSYLFHYFYFSFKPSWP